MSRHALKAPNKRGRKTAKTGPSPPPEPPVPLTPAEEVQSEWSCCLMETAQARRALLRAISTGLATLSQLAQDLRAFSDPGSRCGQLGVFGTCTAEVDHLVARLDALGDRRHGLETIAKAYGITLTAPAFGGADTLPPLRDTIKRTSATRQPPPKDTP